MAVVSVGQAVPGHYVAVVDDKGELLPEREVGHVVVSGQSIMTGYYGDDDGTGAVLRDGWLWTGDLGYFADLNLYLTGRAKDLIIIRGRNIYAEDVERCAERVAGVRPGCVVAFAIHDDGDPAAEEKVVVVAETRKGKAEGRSGPGDPRANRRVLRGGGARGGAGRSADHPENLERQAPAVHLPRALHGRPAQAGAPEPLRPGAGAGAVEGRPAPGADARPARARHRPFMTS
jgi:acyl-CoA synthetase (AMP-forming)/AMP-acid ligase II